MTDGSPSADSKETSGKCGNDLTWNYDAGTSMLTITGTGPMYNYKESDVRWGGNVIKSVSIEDGMTRVGSYAFSYTSISSIVLPDSVTEIGMDAFCQCSSLVSIGMPASLNNIENYAFYKCSALTSVDFPDSLNSIGTSSFLGCSSIESLIIPDSVTSIGPQAFKGCTSVVTATLGDGLESIESSVFDGCDSLVSVFVGKGVTYINLLNAFIECHALESITVDGANTSYSSIDGVLLDKDAQSLLFYPAAKADAVYTVPDGVVIIEDYSIDTCLLLNSVIIGKDVETIGICAFDNCSSLQSVAISASVTSIHETAFTGCTALSNLTVDDDNTAYSSYDNVLFDKDMKTLLIYPQGKMDAVYSIPEGVESTGTHSFDGCVHVETVNIPATLTTIGTGTFWECEALSSIDIPENVTSICESAFYGCTSLTSVILPKSITSIEDKIFYGCSSLKTAPISDSVTRLGTGVFTDCRSLESVYIPDSVTEVGDELFQSCQSLVSVRLPVSMTSIPNGMFWGCISLTSVEISDKIVLIEESAFYGCESLTNVIIPDSVVTIGDNAFNACSSLKDLTIGSSLNSIGMGAFEGCPSLRSVTVDEKNNYFSSENGVLFDKNKETLILYPSMLESSKYDVPASVKSIMMEAFYYCKYLKEIRFAGSLDSIEGFVFYNCTGLVSITFDTDKEISFGQCSFFFMDENEHVIDVYASEGFTIPPEAASKNVRFEYHPIPEPGPGHKGDDNIAIYVAIAGMAALVLVGAVIFIRKR